MCKIWKESSPYNHPLCKIKGTTASTHYYYVLCQKDFTFAHVQTDIHLQHKGHSPLAADDSSNLSSHGCCSWASNHPHLWRPHHVLYTSSRWWWAPTTLGHHLVPPPSLTKNRSKLSFFSKIFRQPHSMKYTFLYAICFWSHTFCWPSKTPDPTSTTTDFPFLGPSFWESVVPISSVTAMMIGFGDCKDFKNSYPVSGCNNDHHEKHDFLQHLWKV